MIELSKKSIGSRQKYSSHTKIPGLAYALKLGTVSLKF